MSVRMLQRALRNQEKQQSTLPLHEEEDEEDSDVQSTETVGNTFDLLGVQDDEEEDTVEDIDHPSENVEQINKARIDNVSSKKSKKKKKKKVGKKVTVDTPEVDDVDQLLKGFSVNEKDKSSLPSTSIGISEHTKPSEILNVDTKHLRAEDELKRIFGSKVINAVERGSSSSIGALRRRQGTTRKIGRGNLLRRTTLVSPKEYWPSWDGCISMEHTGVKDGQQYFKYTYSSSYMETQRKFEMSGASYDPNTIAMLLAHHPYHLESLLALAEVYKHLGEYQQSVECLERCLFALECAWHPSFNPFNGSCRLPFSCDTNKPFFSALSKHMQHLGRRGCHRSALEVCKLLLSLDADDPLGALFSIDYYALRAEQFEWLESFVDNYSSDSALWLLPNFSFSLAVARFYLEQQNRVRDTASSESVSSHSLLKQALMLHPATLSKIVEKAPIKEDAQWGKILKHPHFKKASPGSPSLEHLVNLYVERNHLIWRVPDLQAQLKNAASAVVNAADTDSGEVANWACVRQEAFAAENNEYRHLHFSEFSDTAPPMPPEELQNMIFHGEGDAADRANAMLAAGANNQDNAAALEGRNALLVFLQSLLPWTDYGTDLHGQDVQIVADENSGEEDNDH